MKTLIRSLAAVAVFGLATHGTALACWGELDCQKSIVGIDFGEGLVSGATEITTYPASVKYRIDFTYSYMNDQCAVGWLQDSLFGMFSLPADPYKDGGALWVYNPPSATPDYREYTIGIESFDQCTALGGVLQADGSVKLTNLVQGSSYFEQYFDCSADVVCRPPKDGHGCTLTPGYWKTHSRYGPAPYDATWALIGEDTTFFLSGQSFYTVMWTDSTLKYYILARAYIAAILNGLAGASDTSDVQAAIAFAETFFNTYTPSSTLSPAVRAQVIGMASILDDYNNGLTGPGHCPD